MNNSVDFLFLSMASRKATKGIVQVATNIGCFKTIGSITTFPVVVKPNSRISSISSSIFNLNRY